MLFKILTKPQQYVRPQQPPHSKVEEFSNHFVVLQRIRLIPNKSMINVSEPALSKLQSLVAEEGKNLDSAFIRVGVASGGCSGLSYKMEIVEAEQEGDKLFEDKGVKILVDKKSLLYLLGTTLEYSGGLNGKGFSFNNPNASRTCGCGESFAV